jgi:hypothetical protein
MEFLLINQIAMACKSSKSEFDLSNECRTPIMQWQNIMQINTPGNRNSYRLKFQNQILHYLAQNANSWSIILPRLPHGNRVRHDLYTSISALLRSDDLLCSKSETDIAGNYVSKD